MRSDLIDAYRSILESHLAGVGEEASLRAYDFARQCLREGLAPDDVVALHLDLVHQQELLAQYSDAASRSQDLLLDVVMAFSLSYQQALQKLEQTKAELEKLFSFKSRMLSMVAHDMMNHLVATKMTVLSLKRDSTAPALAPRLENLLQIVDDQEHLIQNLLDLGRIESGRLQLDLEDVDLRRLIERSVVKAQSGTTEHTLRVSGPSITISGDRGKLQQILDNLISNAVKYSPGGGTVDIRIEPRGDRVDVSVRDQGVGIAADDLPHLFEPFYRGKTGRSDIRGTGLGLAIVQSLARMHDGSLEIESESGHGSTFRLSLPMTGVAAETQRTT